MCGIQAFKSEPQLRVRDIDRIVVEIVQLVLASWKTEWSNEDWRCKRCKCKSRIEHLVRWETRLEW
jgi:hypothetical protein